MCAKLLLALAIVCLVIAPARAQDCPTLAAQKPGQWKHKTEDAGTGLMTLVVKTHRAAVSRYVDDLAALLQAAYPQPAGTEAKWWRDLGTSQPLFEGAPAAYALVSNYLGYHCGPSQQPFLADETFTWASIHVNSFGFGLGSVTTSVENLLLDGQPLYTLAPRVETWAGFPVFDLTAPEEANYSERALLIAASGKQPFKPVSQEAFLRVNRALIAERQAADVEIARSSVVIRSLAEQEAEKQYYLDDLEKSYTGDALEARKNRLLADWQSDEEKLEEAVKIAGDFYQKQLDKIDRLLAEGGAALSEPAIIASRNWHPNDIDRYEPLFRAEGQGYLVFTPDPAYFDPAVEPFRPQFLTIYWSWNDVPTSQHFAEQFRENLDVAALAALLRR